MRPFGVRMRPILGARRFISHMGCVSRRSRDRPVGRSRGGVPDGPRRSAAASAAQIISHTGGPRFGRSRRVVFRFARHTRAEVRRTSGSGRRGGSDHAGRRRRTTPPLRREGRRCFARVRDTSSTRRPTTSSSPATKTVDAVELAPAMTTVSPSKSKFADPMGRFRRMRRRVRSARRSRTVFGRWIVSSHR